MQQRVDFFVGTDGDDENPGTRQQPFRTLDRAREAASRLRAANVRTEIYVRSGPYWLSTRLFRGRAA